MRESTKELAEDIGNILEKARSYRIQHNAYPTELKVLAYSLYVMGKSMRDIASILCVPSHSTIHAWVSAIDLAPPAEASLLVQNIKKTMADKCYTMANKVAHNITDEDVEKASLVQKTTAIGTLIDKGRLLEGKSNNNIDVHYQQVEKIASEEDRIAQEIKELESQIIIDVEKEKN